MADRLGIGDAYRFEQVLVEIGRLADLVRSDMQGRLQDAEHWRAYNALGRISGNVSNAVATLDQDDIAKLD